MAENSRPIRADYRLSITLNVRLTWIDPKTKRTRNLNAVTRNLSASGIYIVTTQPFPLSVPFIIHFQNSRELPIAPQATALLEYQLEDGQFGYGCKYENFSEEFESKMRAFLFRQEALFRKRLEEDNQTD